MRYRRYTDEEMIAIARKIGVSGNKEGHIDTNGVAIIWTWRIEHENDMKHEYTPTSVRKRVFDKTLTPIKKEDNKRMWFSIEDAFIIPLYPKKIVSKKK